MDEKKQETLLTELGIEIDSSLEDVLKERAVSFGPVDWSKVNQAPIGFIKEEDTELDATKLILKRFFGGESSLAADENYQDIIERAGTFKVMSGKSLGSYSDVVAAVAEDEGLNLTLIRNFSVQLFSFLDYLHQSDLMEYPVDVDYGRTKDCFFVQVHCAELGIYFENLMESVQESSLLSPFSSLLKELSEKANFLEVYTLKSTKRLVISAVWKLNQKEKAQPSLIIHQVEKFKKLKDGEVDYDIKTFFDSDADRIHKIRSIEKTPQKHLVQEKSRELYNPALVKRIVLFLRKKKGVVDGVLTGEVDQNGLRKYIQGFPDKDALSSLNQYDEEQIYRILRDSDDDIDNQTESLKDQISENDYVEGIINSLSKMSADEAKSALGFDDEEEAQVIKGEKEDLGEDIYRVSGSNLESRDKDEVMRIKGVTENLQDKPWHVKRLNVTEKVKERLNKMKEKGASRKDIDLEVKSILMNELSLKEEEGSSFINALSDDVTDDWVRGGLDPINDSIKQRVKIEKIENQLHTRDQQIVKMKKLIDNMKTELLNKQKQIELQSSLSQVSESLSAEDFSHKVTVENEQTPVNNDSVSVEGGNELTELKAEIAVLNRENQKVNNEVIKLKSENETLLRKRKDGQEDIGELRGSGDDVTTLQKENTNLQAQVESLKKRLSFMYENNRSNGETNVDASDIERIITENEAFKEQRQKYQQEIESSKTEKRDLEQRLRTIVAENDRLKLQADNKKMSQDDRQLLIEKERDIERLNNDLKRASDEIKALHIKGKSYEQKIKFMSAQINKSGSERSHGRGAGSKAADAKLAHKLKASENMNLRLKEAADKLNNELGDKKTELHKAKLEAKTLENKVKELEKKLAQNEKKRAA